MLASSISWVVAGSVIATLISIAASGILSGAVLLLWAVNGIRGGGWALKMPPFTPALLGIFTAVLVAVVFSADPASSSFYLTRLARLLPVFWMYTFLSRSQFRRTYLALIVVVGMSALLGVAQYYWLLDVHLVNRIRGFMSHWMTFSGQLMLGITALAALLLFGREWLPGRPQSKRSPFFGGLVRLLPWLVVFALLGIALLLTFTRNAWFGTFFSVSCLLLWKGRRWVLSWLLLAVLALLLLPFEFSERILAGFDPTDTTNQGRVELVKTGLRMIRDNPLTGVGPRMVPHMAPQYAERYDENDKFPEWLYQHLHNTPIQVAAETGLLGLAAWLFLWVMLFRDFWRFSRYPDPEVRFLAINGIAVLLAFLTAGLFEYNLGDSEILTLLLFFVTAPYVAIRDAPQSTA